jgi:hypothetical protein
MDERERVDDKMRKKDLFMKEFNILIKNEILLEHIKSKNTDNNWTLFLKNSTDPIDEKTLTEKISETTKIVKKYNAEYSRISLKLDFEYFINAFPGDLSAISNEKDELTIYNFLAGEYEDDEDWDESLDKLGEFIDDNYSKPCDWDTILYVGKDMSSVFQDKMKYYKDQIMKTRKRERDDSSEASKKMRTSHLLYSFTYAQLSGF